MAADTARQILFPYCAACIAHVSLAERGATISAIALAAGLLAGLAVGILVDLASGLILLGTGFGIAIVLGTVIQLRAKRRSSRTCCGLRRAVAFYGWSGSATTFSFASASYRVRFAAANVASLVNVDAKFERMVLARIGADGASSPGAKERTIDEWLILLENQTTTVARRMALVEALQLVEDSDRRRILVTAVARFELASLLSRTEGAPEKRVRAITAELRADNLPEELKFETLRELTRRRAQ